MQKLLILCLLLATGKLCGQAGMLDESFGQQGIVTTSFGTGDAQCTAVLALPNGALITAGVSAASSTARNFTLVKYLKNGLPDPTFGNGGQVISPATTADEFAQDLLLQPDGKMLVAGHATLPDRGQVLLARYLPNGSLDVSFGASGVAKINLTTNVFADVCTAALLPDGKILVAGFTRSAGNLQDFLLARFLPGGQPDNGFGNGGLRIIDHTFQDNAHDLRVLPDGKILLTGYVTAAPQANLQLILMQLLPDGAFDTSFGAGGKVILTDATNQVGRTLLQLPDGKIVVAGQSNAINNKRSFATFRFLPNGALDNSFGTGGRVVVPVGTTSTETAMALLRQADGKLVLTGHAVRNGTIDFAVVRLLENGSPDPGFGGGGVVTTAIGGSIDQALDGVFDSDGNLVAAGFSIDATSGTSVFALARYQIGLVSGVKNTAPLEAQIFPNPASSTLDVSYQLTASTDVAIQLMDATGRVLQSFPTQTQPAGMNKQHLVLSPGLPTGLCFLWIHDGYSTTTIPVQIIR
jgi:uncharacterized delta-60 repeat protein